MITEFNKTDLSRPFAKITGYREIDEILISGVTHGRKSNSGRDFMKVAVCAKRISGAEELRRVTTPATHPLVIHSVAFDINKYMASGHTLHEAVERALCSFESAKPL